MISLVSCKGVSAATVDAKDFAEIEVHPHDNRVTIRGERGIENVSLSIAGSKAERMALLNAWITGEGYDPAALSFNEYTKAREAIGG